MSRASNGARTKASAKVLQKPRRFRDILDRVAMDEAKTLRAIGGERLAGAFLRAYAAAEPMEILEGEVGFVVRMKMNGALAMVDDAPGVTPDLPEAKSKLDASIRRSAKQTARAG